MKRCVKCSGFQIHGIDDRYCCECGEELVDCPRCECKYEFGFYDNYCPKCGKKRPVSSSDTLLGDAIGSMGE